MSNPTHEQIAVAAYYLYRKWEAEAFRLEMSYPGTWYFWFLAEIELEAA